MQIKVCFFFKGKKHSFFCFCFVLFNILILESALDINVNKKTFEQHDLENINWISHLTYLDPNADIRDCTAQG